MRWAMASLVALALCNIAAAASDERADRAEVVPTIAEATEGMQRVEGLLTCWVDRDQARLLLEVPAPDGGGVAAELLYVEGLLTGVGSNPLGLDRGQLGRAKHVALRRLGDRVLLEERNPRFRSLSSDEDEARAVRQSFATSVLWAEKIVAREADGRSLVDLASFLIRDAHGVEARMRARKQGSFRLDPARSVVDVEAFLAFPDNLELEAVLTFAGTDPGELVRGTAPTAEAVTVVQHQSLIRLPDEEYQPRRFDPRCASFAVSFSDYAAPLSTPIETRWIVRHRLEKLDPSAARSRVREPIVYYVDRGAPEPVRSALVEGASWWAEAFEAAGFLDAFRVELLPDGAHPLDSRYNVIQWVHRSTRGWSYGSGITDPRTGEMIKGHVSLGSLRVRHDRLLLEGLVGTDATGSGAANDPVEVALARIRQLSAHEVGHTLGFTHNFAASAYGGRASVMDYPAPLVKLDEKGGIDLSEAYGIGVGAWDIHAVRYAYAQPAPGQSEDELLEDIVRDGLQRQLAFAADADARPMGSAHPRAHLWDNGSDPVAALEHAFEVRRVALQGFGEHNLAEGRPLSRLLEVFSPVYLYHRYQLIAAAKVIAGLEYGYAVRGDGQPAARPVDGAWQRRALSAVLHGLDPDELAVPEQLLGLMPPPAFGYGRSREELRSTSAPVFDPLGAAATAADLVVQAVLAPERCSRLVAQSTAQSGLPSLEEVLEALIARVFDPAATESADAEIRRVVRTVVVHGLIELAASNETPAWVGSRVESALQKLEVELEERIEDSTGAEQGHDQALVAKIDRFLRHREWDDSPSWRPSEAPPGDPIGDGLMGCGLATSDGEGWEE